MLSSGGRPTRRERERMRHREEILGAASRLAESRGLDGVTMDDVAREAEFAVGSIYSHFRSKDELVSELMLERVRRFLDDVEALLARGQPFAELLLALARLTYEGHQKMRPILVAWMELPALSKAGASSEAMATLRERGRALFDAVMAQGQAEGVLAAGDRRPLTIALTGILLAFSKANAFASSPVEGDVPALAVRLFLEGAKAR